MIQKKEKKLFLIIFICIFFFLQDQFIFLMNAYGKTSRSSKETLSSVEEYNSAFANGGGFYASKPECPNPPIAVIITGLFTVKFAGKKVIQGVRQVISDPKSPKGWALIAIGTTAITAFVLTAGPTWQCYFSFVRDPIGVDENGFMLGKDDNGKIIQIDKINSTNNKENRLNSFLVPYSDYLTICARSSTPYINPFNPKKEFTCYEQDIDSETFDNNEYFDGKKALLCPEEWRVHNYKYEIALDPINNNDGYAKIAKILDEEQDSLTDFLEMKKNNAPLVCKTGKNGDEFTINGYNYRVKKIGAKICGQILGLDIGITTLPSISGPMTLGCHYKTPEDLAPMCKSSIPIKVKDPITEKEVIIDYDNSSCFSCIIDKSCYSKSAIHAKSVFPVSSSIVECFESSINHILFGCEKTQSNDKFTTGMLTIANKNLSFLGYTAILLFIIIFGIKITLGSYIPQANEVFAIILKIGIILFFIYADSQKRGVYWLYNQVLNVSSGLSSIMLDAISKKNNICKFDSSLYKIKNQNISYRNDFNFLRPFDILDCNTFFYIGGYLFGFDDNDSPLQWKKILNFVPRLLTMIFPILFVFDIIGLVMFFFSVLIIALVVWIVSLTVYSILFLSILILISPLIIPSILFPYTKGFFDAWLRELFAYTMILPFLYLFLTLMLTCFNGPIFGDTKFKQIIGYDGARQIVHFAYENIDCKANEEKPICKSCLELTNDDYDICDGCDIKSLSCKMRYQKLLHKSFLFGIFFIGHDSMGSYMLNILSNIGQLLILALIFLTLLKSIIIIIARSLGGSRTLYKLLDHGEDPISNFFKYSKKGLGIGGIQRKAGKKASEKTKSLFKKNNEKNNEKNNSSGIKGSFN